MSGGEVSSQFTGAREYSRVEIDANGDSVTVMDSSGANPKQDLLLALLKVNGIQQRVIAATLGKSESWVTVSLQRLGLVQVKGPKAEEVVKVKEPKAATEAKELHPETWKKWDDVPVIVGVDFTETKGALTKFWELLVDASPDTETANHNLLVKFPGRFKLTEIGRAHV